MLRITAFAGALLCLLITGLNPAIAGSRLHPDCNVLWPCAVPNSGRTHLTHDAHNRRDARQVARAQRFNRTELGGPLLPPETQRSFLDKRSSLVAPLADKLASIQSACPGTVAISGVRHTKVRGTNRWSLHTQGKAVDVRGDYRCIFAQLQGWPGGYSIDPGRVRHVHVSYDADGGREWGVRFAHGGHRKHRQRVASR